MIAEMPYTPVVREPHFENRLQSVRLHRVCALWCDCEAFAGALPAWHAFVTGVIAAERPRFSTR